MMPCPTKRIGHGNAIFLAALEEPGQTRTKQRTRLKAGEFPDLWQGASQWLDFKRVPA